MNATQQKIAPGTQKSCIVTKGDARVSIIDALGDLSHVSLRVQTTLNHLHDYILNVIDASPEKRKIIKQILLLKDSSEYTTEKLRYITSQSRMTSIANRAQSRKRTACNLESILENAITKGSKRERKSYIQPEDNILAKLIQPSIAAKISKHMNLRKPAVLSDGKLPKPQNGSVFTLKEAFAIMTKCEYKPSVFYDKATNVDIHGRHPQLLMNKSSWYRRWNKYCTDDIMPADNDYGIARGAPPILNDQEIALLNDDLHITVGTAEDDMELSDKIISVKEKQMEKNRQFPHLKKPASSTVQLYQTLSVVNDPDIHLIRQGKIKVKDPRRQMASTSVRNLASHIAAVAYANFIPCAEKWVVPKGLPIGCLKMIDMLKKVTGAHFQPIKPAYILNGDCSSQYYCSGISSGDSGNNKWSRVTTES